jgi:Lipase (class 3)
MTAPTDSVLMTLAGVAYGDPARVPGYLAAATPTAGWQVIWMPEVGEAPDNFMFLATDGRGSYVVAIRGTYPNPFSEAYWHDGNQDSPFGTMADWPGAPGAKIGGGTQTGLTNLLALKDAKGQSLAEAVACLPADAVVTVTGHSLGGTLAPVLALALATADSSSEIQATSFAGMTPGNAAFAALFGAGTRLSGRVRRVYNTLDTVSYGWDRVWATHGFYQPAPQGGDVVSALLLATEARLKLGGYEYAPVGLPVPLPGQVRPATIPCALAAYVIENLHQHLPDTYLSLLGAPPLPFSIIWGSMTVPRSHPLAGRLPSPGGAVVHLPG